MKTINCKALTRSTIAMLFFGVLSAPHRASAEPSPPSEQAKQEPLELEHWSEDHPWRISVHAGMATPYGVVGAELERNINHLLSLAVGAGQGAYDQQLAAALRVRWDLGRVALGVSLGPGFGDSESFSTSGEKSRHYGDAIWLNAELYAEFRTQSGVFLRSFAGVARTLSSTCTQSDAGADTPNCQTDPNLILPVLGLAIGYGF